MRTSRRRTIAARDKRAEVERFPKRPDPNRDDHEGKRLTMVAVQYSAHSAKDCAEATPSPRGCPPSSGRCPLRPAALLRCATHPRVALRGRSPRGRYPTLSSRATGLRRSICSPLLRLTGGREISAQGESPRRVSCPSRPSRRAIHSCPGLHCDASISPHPLCGGGQLLGTGSSTKMKGLARDHEWSFCQ